MTGTRTSEPADGPATPPRERAEDGPGRLAAVYGVFALLVLVYTWPLARNPGAHLRQWLDVHYFVWEMGWVARRILAAPISLFDANIFYPHGLSLAYSEPMLVPAVPPSPRCTRSAGIPSSPTT
jgi:hypothetical protein